MTNGLQRFLSSISEFTEANNLLSAYSETLIYEKNEVLFARGKVANAFMFIEEGTVLGTTIMPDRIRTHRFWIKGQVLFPAESVFSNKPMQYSCTAMERTTVSTISYSHLQEFARIHEDGSRLINRLFNLDLSFWQDRINSLRELTPLERYQKLLSEYPNLEQVIKSEFIASYLNLSYATLSRLKKIR